MGRMHITLGDKGGTGKSFVAVLMMQYILDNFPAVTPVGIDLDPKNSTFSRYKNLNVTLVDVRTEGDIDRSKFDILINRVVGMAEDEVFIVDVGGNVYVSLSDYLRVNEIFRLLMSQGVEIIMHIPIVGGGDLFPTLKTLDELMLETPDEVQAAIWINQKNGRVEYKGKSFESSERYQEYKERIRTVTYIPLWRPDMQVNVAAMLEEAITFDQVPQHEMFDLVSKQRLVMAQRYLYESIEKSGVCL